MNTHIFIFLALALFIAACTSTERPAESGKNASTQAPAAPQEPAEPAEISGNITAPPEPYAESNGADQTDNDSAAAAPPPAASPQSPPDGILFANGTYLLALDDVSITPVSDSPCGIFSIRHPLNGTVIEKLFICPGDSQYWDSPGGEQFRIFVTEVAAGYTNQSKWAKVIIYG